MKIKALLFLIYLAANFTTISTLQCAAAAGAGAVSKEEADKKSNKDFFIVSFNKDMKPYLDSSSLPERPPLLNIGLKSGHFWGWKPTDKHIEFDKINYEDSNISFKFKINSKINGKEESIDKIILPTGDLKVKPGYRYFFSKYVDLHGRYVKDFFYLKRDGSLVLVLEDRRMDICPGNNDVFPRFVEEKKLV